MKFIKKFELFKEELLASPKESPSRPSVRPGTSPAKRPGKPSPIRRDKPAVEPAPKANKELKTATIDEVIEKFAKLTNQDI
jgi:hypothetical protein